MVSTALTTSGRAWAISSTYGGGIEHNVDNDEGTTHGEVLEWSSLLDIGQGRLEILELFVDLLRGLLCLSNLFETHVSERLTPYSKGNN
jgi:hypothetical protein